MMREILRGFLCCGLPVSLAGTALMSAALTAADLPLQWYPAAAALPLCAGCFGAGFSAGKAARRNGFRCGISAALLLCLFWYAGVCIMGGSLRSLMLLTVTLPFGICGGICGVNTRQPLPRRRSHTVLRLRENALLRGKTVHKPKKQPLSSPDSHAADG